MPSVFVMRAPAPADLAGDAHWYHLHFGSVIPDEQPTTVYRTAADRSARLYTDSGAGVWRLDLSLTPAHTYRCTAWIRQVTGDGSSSARECDLEVQDSVTTTQTVLQTFTTFDNTGWTRLQGTFTASHAGNNLVLQGDAGIGGLSSWSMYVSDWEVVDIT